MPEAAAFRVDLSASRRASRLRLVGRLLTLSALAACAAAVLLDPSPLRLAAALAAVGALALACRAGREAATKRLSVAPDGTIRAGAGDATETAIVRYCGRHLVCLEVAGRRLTVWPDSMSPVHWRRLIVACRWQRRRAGDDRPSASGLRTK